MIRMHTLLPLFLLCCAATTHAQLYKWVGPDGKVTYSDTAPPTTAANVETKSLNTTPGEGALPFELAEAAKNHPVTLYTGAKCIPCDDGRNILQARGIPFTEKTVTTNEDVALLRDAGASLLPLLMVGRQKQIGFESTAWNALLTAAGYPEGSKLPATYRNPLPEAAAPAPKAAAGKQPGSDQTTSRPAESLPPAIGNNVPPGFRF